MKNTIVFDEENCLTKLWNYLSAIKEEVKEVDHKIVEYRFQTHVQNGSVCDNWLILKNLICERKICNNIKSGKGINLMKNFNAYKFNDEKKSVPIYVYFR